MRRGRGKVILLILVIWVAIVTTIGVVAVKNNEKKEKEADCGCNSAKAAKRPQHNAIEKIISTVGLCFYFLISFATGAWYITWLIFPIMAAVKQLINACMDLKEGK